MPWHTAKLPRLWVKKVSSTLQKQMIHRKLCMFTGFFFFSLFVRSSCQTGMCILWPAEEEDTKKTVLYKQCSILRKVNWFSSWRSLPLLLQTEIKVTEATDYLKSSPTFFNRSSLNSMCSTSPSVKTKFVNRLVWNTWP